MKSNSKDKKEGISIKDLLPQSTIDNLNALKNKLEYESKGSNKQKPLSLTPNSTNLSKKQISNDRKSES